MDLYTLTRQEAADKLEISVRSIDRYIKSGKIRSEKKGKSVYVHIDDISNMLGGTEKNSHIIITENEKQSSKDFGNDQFLTQGITKKDEYNKLTKTFENVYKDLRNQIEKKDDLIHKMSIEIGKTQEQVKQSISVSEHNRSQMLLEESKTHIAKQMTSLNDSKKELEDELKKERFDKKVLIILVFIFLGLSAYFWFKIV